jgi:hypothetical protein
MNRFNFSQENLTGYESMSKGFSHEVYGIYRLMIYRQFGENKSVELSLREVALEYGYLLRLLDEMGHVLRVKGSLPADWRPPFNRCNYQEHPFRCDPALGECEKSLIVPEKVH